MVELILSFRPWNPRTWSFIPMLLSLIILYCLILSSQTTISNIYDRERDLFDKKFNNFNCKDDDVISTKKSFTNNNNSKSLLFSCNDDDDDNLIKKEEKEYLNKRLILMKNYLNYSLIISKILILTLILIKIKSFFNQRYEAHKIFDLGNVPSISNKSPLTGNLMELMVPNFNIQIHFEWHKRLGKTFGIFYGPDPWILTIDLELLQKIFILDGQKLNGHTQFRLPFVSEFGKSVVQCEGDEWKKQRKILDPFFSHHQMKKDNVYNDLDKCCRKFLDLIENHPLILSVDSNQDQNSQAAHRIIDVNYNFKKFSVDVIFQIAFGVENGIDMTKFDNKIELIDKVHEASYEIRCFFVWFCISFGEYLEKFMGNFIKFSSIGKYINYIHKVLDKSFSDRKKLHNNNNNNNNRKKIDKNQRKMIDTLIECVENNKLDLISIKSNLFFIFLAGFETTANTLATMFWLLANNLKFQNKLRDSIILDGEKSKYLDWCIQETLRLYPAVPAGAGRPLLNDLEFNGMKFFKGTTINCSIYTLHRWEEYWGKDANEFNPERFENKKLHPAQYFAFGIGPRYCLGQQLAMAELRSITSRILVKYKIEKCSTTPVNLPFISPNLIHMILEGEINLKFIELSSL